MVNHCDEFYRQSSEILREFYMWCGKTKCDKFHVYLTVPKDCWGLLLLQ